MSATVVPTVEVTGYLEQRHVERVGDRLVRGDTTHHLVLRFPDGQEHLAKVSSEAYEGYLTAIGVQGVTQAATTELHDTNFG